MFLYYKLLQTVLICNSKCI